MHQRAAAGKVDHWAETAEGALALVIVLDQFSRDLNRGSAAAFAKYPKTLSIAETAIEKGWDQQFPVPNEEFFYLPLEHSDVLRQSAAASICSRRREWARNTRKPI